MKWYDIRFWKWACIGLVIGVILLAFTGCKTKEYIKVPSVRTEYVCRTDTFAKKDSIYMKDSVYVFQKGDTVFHNKVVYRDRYHNIYKVKTDTIIKRDSVAVPYPIERQLTKNEQRLMSLGRCYIAFLFVLAACAIGFTLWHRNKKC
nr:MAG: hypothetical protein [Bacteriophage sp.]